MPEKGPAHSDCRSRRVISTTLDNDSAQWRRAVDAIIEHVEALDYPKASRFAIRLALEEAIVNAFKHGHRELPGTPIVLEASIGEAEVVMSIKDSGPGFDPEAIPDPTLDENLDKPGGRGLMLIRAYMTEVRHLDGGTRLELRYRRPPDPS